MSPETAWLFAGALGTTPEFWINLQAAYDLAVSRPARPVRRLRQFVAVQEARTDQALARWEHTVLIALEESENAMTAFVREQVRRESLLEAASQARLAVELTRSRYTEGLSDFESVLVSQRALADLEDALAASEASVATDLIRLYKALGGGWDEGEPVLAVAP